VAIYAPDSGMLLCEQCEPHMGSGAVMCPGLFVDFDAIYSCLFVYLLNSLPYVFLSLCFLSYLLPYSFNF